jgi:hypothetical protein
MMGKCALCGEDKELQLSHIIPKFIGKYLKNTSIGNIRSHENPNRIAQDIEKHYMLCHDCEELFSASERYFANTIFYPYKKDKKDKFGYDKRLFYFLTSLSWRSLYLDIIDFVKEKTLKIDALEGMIQSEKIMREFLLSRRDDLGNIEHHIFFFDRIMNAKTDGDNLFKSGRPHTTIHRSLTSYSGYSGNTIYTISNLMGIIIVTLYSRNDNEVWKGTQVFNDSQTIVAANQIVESSLGNEFIFWIEQSEQASSAVSEEEEQKILKRITDVGNKIVEYDVYQDMVDDIKLKNNS